MKTDAATSEFTSGDLYIDYRSRLVKINGQEVQLTHTEYELLNELTQNAGAVLSYTRLLHSIWGSEYSGEKQYLHQYICYLRKKIEPDPRNPIYIHTIPKLGYVFRDKE